MERVFRERGGRVNEDLRRLVPAQATIHPQGSDIAAPASSVILGRMNTMPRQTVQAERVADSTAAHLNDAARWNAVVGHDGAADGLFVYAVPSTRVDCRPPRPSPRPPR